MPPPFKFWTADHWLNFGIFLCGQITLLGVGAATTWNDLPKLFTPAAIIGSGGIVVSILAFLRSSATNAARDPNIGTRSTDPAPTERVIGGRPVPPVTPGRPVEPEKENP